MHGHARLLWFCAFGLALCGSVCSARQQPSVQANAPAGGAGAPPSGAITGVVSDGVTKRPIAGAVVALTSGGRGASFTTSRISTDSKGRFVFEHLSASDAYTINTNKFGYTESTGKAFPAGGARIALAAGEWIANADIVLWPPGAISGTVVDERGEPVVDIPVRVLAQIPVAGQYQLAAGPVTTTDDRGSYRIAGLARGKYVVNVPSVQSTVPVSTPAASLSGGGRAGPANSSGLDLGATRLVIGNYATPPSFQGRSQSYPVLFYLNARSAAGAAVVDVKEGQELQDIDFGLQPVSTARVSGKVVGDADMLTSLVVRLSLEGSEDLGIGSEAATALVAGDGAFTFLGVPEGRYTLMAKPTVNELIAHRGGPAIMAGLPGTPGLSLTSGSGAPVASAPEGTMFATRGNAAGIDFVWGRLHLDVGTEDVSGVVLTLRRGATLSGRFVYEGTARPGVVPRASVEPATGSASLGVGFRPVQGTAPDSFAIQGLKGGEYSLRVAGAPALSVKSIVADGVDYADRPFDASSGADITGVVVTLTDKVTSLSGIVRDRQGNPVPQAAVIAFPVDKSLWTRYGFNPPRIKAVSFFGKGAYKLTGLPKGDYHLIAVDASMLEAWQDPQFFPAAVASAARVTLDWGDQRVQDLTISQVTIK